jgi:hypothetical protein
MTSGAMYCSVPENKVNDKCEDVGVRTSEGLSHGIETGESFARAEVRYLAHPAVRINQHVIALDVSMNNLLRVLHNKSDII